MSKLHDKFADLLSEIEQMEKEKANLVDIVEKLEKEKADGYSKFDTKTHALIKREDLRELSDQIEEAVSDILCAEGYSDDMYSQAEEVNSNCGYARKSAERASRKVDDMLSDKGDE